MFNGSERIIELSSDVTRLDVRVLYSEWKRWVWSGEGAKYLEAFRVVGGDPIDESRGIYITPYFYLTNGWKILPPDLNCKITVENGVLLTEDGSSPFLFRQGRTILIEYSQPVKTESVVVETGVSGLTEEESRALNEIRQKVLSLDEIFDMISDADKKLLLLVSFIKNKKYLEKRDGKWYLVVRNDDDTDDILRKELKDINGNPIEDISAGIIAREEKSVK